MQVGFIQSNGTEDSTVWENTDIDNSTKYHSKDSGESDPKKLLEYFNNQFILLIIFFSCMH